MKTQVCYIALALFQLDQASYMVEGDTANPADAYYTQNGKNEFKGIEIFNHWQSCA